MGSSVAFSFLCSMCKHFNLMQYLNYTIVNYPKSVHVYLYLVDSGEIMHLGFFGYFDVLHSCSVTYYSVLFLLRNKVTQEEPGFILLIQDS